MDAILFDEETSVLRSLIQALGAYEPADVDPTDRKALVNQLELLFRDHPDAGIHSAAELTMRRWMTADDARSIDAPELAYEKRDGRRWYTSGQGQTFAVIEGPVTFSMGSATTDTERSAATETVRHVSIPRRFAISTREVTVAQFQEFVKQHRLLRMDGNSLRRFGAGSDGPGMTVDWYSAAAYCNWLSEKEGLPKHEWCYERNPEGGYNDGMRLRADALARTGYRLPTEAEWEYSCRAGAMTVRYYGNSTELLGRYAWFQANSDEQTRPTGGLLPNDLGLFDMLGNVYEWCQDRNEPYRFAEKGIYKDLVIDEVIKDGQSRRYRGGAFAASAGEARSASRGAEIPSYYGFMIGFRVARTLPPSP